MLNEADSKSLQIFKFKTYAKDKFHAYYEGRIIQDADINTFKPIDNFYAADKNHAYHGGVKIAGSDGESFSLIKESWSKDKNNVYYGVNAIGVCDLPTFSVSSSYFGWWAVDSKCVYFRNLKLAIKDRNTFTILQHGYAKDQYQVYYQDKVVTGADPETFHTNYSGFSSKDKHSCYKFARKVACGK